MGCCGCLNGTGLCGEGMRVCRCASLVRGCCWAVAVRMVNRFRDLLWWPGDAGSRGGFAGAGRYGRAVLLHCCDGASGAVLAHCCGVVQVEQSYAAFWCTVALCVVISRLAEVVRLCESGAWCCAACGLRIVSRLS